MSKKIQFLYLGREDEGFEDSLDKSMFCSRVENLDLKLGQYLSLLIYTTLAEMPGVARKIKKSNFVKKKFSLCCPKGTHGIPQQIRSSRLVSFS